MIRFGVKEYIRNIWFHLCMIVILCIMLSVSTVFVSNLYEQTKIYRLTEDYLDDDSFFVGTIWEKNYEKTNVTGNVLFNRLYWGQVEEAGTDTILANVYPDAVMNYMKPRLEAGSCPKEGEGDDTEISVLISKNPYGLRAGDHFVYRIRYDEKNYIEIPMYAAGILSDGQRLYLGSELKTSLYMSYEDFFPVYSYEQTQEVQILIPEYEFQRIKVKLPEALYMNGIINPSDTLSDDEKEAMRQSIFQYTDMGVYPPAERLVENRKTLFYSTLLKNIPLVVIIVLLFSISIMGILTIKTMKSVRYYGIMYACGMRVKTAVFFTAAEMCVNAAAALLLFAGLLTIQKKFKPIGEINASLGTAELMFAVGICVLLILGSVWNARSILKEHTPIQILRDRD